MKTQIITLLFALMISGPVIAQQLSENPGLQEVIRTLDLAHASAIFEGDALALERLMSDDVTVNHPTNRIVKEKKELLNLIEQGTIRYTRFERTPEKFLFFKNMVVVMGSEIVVPAKGAPDADQILHRRYTNIWMKQHGKWQLKVRHAHNVCEEEGLF